MKKGRSFNSKQGGQSNKTYKYLLTNGCMWIIIRWNYRVLNQTSG